MSKANTFIKESGDNILLGHSIDELREIGVHLEDECRTVTSEIKKVVENLKNIDHYKKSEITPRLTDAKSDLEFYVKKLGKWILTFEEEYI
jgi:hypothetical protein